MRGASIPSLSALSASLSLSTISSLSTLSASPIVGAFLLGGVLLLGLSCGIFNCFGGHGRFSAGLNVARRGGVYPPGYSAI